LYAYPHPNTDSDEYFDHVFTPRISGSSFSILGSQRVSDDSVTIGIGNENLKVLADFRHSARFSWGMRISMVLGSSLDVPIIRIITKMNFIPLPPSQKHPRTYSAFYTKCLCLPPSKTVEGDKSASLG
jgi:hypothetical protein